MCDKIDSHKATIPDRIASPKPIKPPKENNQRPRPQALNLAVPNTPTGYYGHHRTPSNMRTPTTPNSILRSLFWDAVEHIKSPVVRSRNPICIALDREYEEK